MKPKNVTMLNLKKIKRISIFLYGVLINTIGHITKAMIEKDGICFNTYSINNGYNQYCRDMKRFNSKDELLGFVVGYNQAIQDGMIYELDANK